MAARRQLAGTLGRKVQNTPEPEYAGAMWGRADTEEAVRPQARAGAHQAAPRGSERPFSSMANTEDEDLLLHPEHPALTASDVQTAPR
jgi:hypothetical protein